MIKGSNGVCMSYKTGRKRFNVDLFIFFLLFYYFRDFVSIFTSILDLPFPVFIEQFDLYYAVSVHEHAIWNELLLTRDM